MLYSPRHAYAYRISAWQNQAVAVLQRDLEREEEKVREAEAERARAKAAEPPQTDADVEMAAPSDVPSDLQSSPPSGAITGAGRAPLRRQSKNLTLSTLHRNPFSLKIDLSSSALRLDTDEGGLDMSSLGDLSSFGNLGPLGAVTGLASPVTLAPKSARAMGPGELPPDVLAALASAQPNPQEMHGPQLPPPTPSSSSNVDIDLTLDDNLPAGMDLLTAGSSADKPIELDLDLDVQMSEIASGVFGDQSTNTGQVVDQAVTDLESLFSPVTGQGDHLPAGPSTEGMDMSILNALSEGQEQTDAAAFLASLGAQDGASQGAANVTKHDEATGFNSERETANNSEFDFSNLDMSNVEEMTNMGDLFGSAGTESAGGEGMDDLQKLLGMEQAAPEGGSSSEGNSADSSSQPSQQAGSGPTS